MKVTDLESMEILDKRARETKEDKEKNKAFEDLDDDFQKKAIL